MKLFFAVIVTFWLSILTVSAQRWEIGVWAGMANYFGDLNTNTSFEYMGPGAGMILRNNFSNRWAYKTGFNFGVVAYEDLASGYPYQKARNLSFRSNIFEISNEMEFNFMRYEKERPEFKFTPYLTIGVSVFFFNPTAEFEGERYNLRDLGTEGQKNPDAERRPYSRVSAALVAGGGFKYAFHPKWALGIETSVRRTFTDYLDDVSTVYPSGFSNGDGTSADARKLSDRSIEIGEPIGIPGKQRGTSKKKDHFLFTGISLTYTILKEKCPKPSKVVGAGKRLF